MTSIAKKIFATSLNVPYIIILMIENYFQIYISSFNKTILSVIFSTTKLQNWKIFFKSESFTLRFTSFIYKSFMLRFTSFIYKC